MNKHLGTVDGVLNFYCLRPDHIDVYDEHVLRSAYDNLAAQLANRTAEVVAVQAELAALKEAAGKVPCATCGGDYEIVETHPWTREVSRVPCPDCADLRAILERKP
jgi:Zn finger protein HypA/HybF involved in hydrogenase expression